jgi:hypothetical protein
MLDFVLLLSVFFFFALSILLIKGLEKLKD